MIRDHTSQNLRIEKGAKPGSMEAFAEFSSMRPSTQRMDDLSFPHDLRRYG
jgi:hypothetical protein